MRFWAITVTANVSAPQPAARVVMSPVRMRAALVAPAPASSVFNMVVLTFVSVDLNVDQVSGTMISPIDQLSSDRSDPMPADPPKLRERQAELTRAEILAAARRLFAERGFTRTSVRDIAQAAGVSAQTVYDSIGSKQAVVARLNDLIDSEAHIGTIAKEVADSQDPRQVAAMSAKVTRSILEHCADIIHALVSGAAA